ncbi:MAG: (2Fe-2S) ferredoxin domain-containing protein [Tannerella sp.]|nr:(2Fe-2S) ferredoxin domain-containing protein [Tannerella sp.]
MRKPDYTILVCNSYRASGDVQGYCNKQGAMSFLQYITEECADRGIDAVVTTTACLSLCSQGPIVIIQPNNYWYGGVTKEKLDEILDALEEDKEVADYTL